MSYAIGIHRNAKLSRPKFWLSNQSHQMEREKINERALTKKRGNNERSSYQDRQRTFFSQDMRWEKENGATAPFLH
jgi:hypothetical protein